MSDNVEGESSRIVYRVQLNLNIDLVTVYQTYQGIAYPIPCIRYGLSRIRHHRTIHSELQALRVMFFKYEMYSICSIDENS